MENERGQAPLVTIGIPTYNRYDQLKECLGNVLNQTYTNLEILISDNTENCETPNWLESLALENSKVEYIKQKLNLGAIGNHQYIVDHAKGEYFMFLQDDDEIPNNYVEVLLKYLENNKKVSLIGPCSDRYLDGEYWLTYKNWDSRGKSTFQRLYDLIPDGYIYHWRFEQYLHGIFKIGKDKIRVSRDFKSQFKMFFEFSSQGELMNAEEVKLIKNTSKEEIEKYKTGSVYRRHFLLRPFRDDHVRSIQQCTPIFFQMMVTILACKSLTISEKSKLIIRNLKYFISVSIVFECPNFVKRMQLLWK